MADKNQLIAAGIEHGNKRKLVFTNTDYPDEDGVVMSYSKPTGRPVWRSTTLATSITVNPALPPSNTNFTTIQGAIDALLNLRPNSASGVDILISPGTYVENVVSSNRVSSDAKLLRFRNTATRNMDGMGIKHGAGWNEIGTAASPEGGGVNSQASLVAVGNTLTVTAVVGINPNFVLGGVVPGDLVNIHDDGGLDSTYTVAAGGVTPTTLTFTTAITGTIGATVNSVAFVALLPRVRVQPTAGDVWVTSIAATYIGVAFRSNAVIQFGVTGANMRVRSNCSSAFQNCLWDGAGTSLWCVDDAMIPPATNIGNLHGAASTVTVGTNSYGCTLMGASSVGGGQGFVASGCSTFVFLHSIISASNTAAGGSTQYNAIMRMDFCKFVTGTAIGCNVTNESKMVFSSLTHFFCRGGTGILITRGSGVSNHVTGDLRIRGAPAIGIDIQQGSSYEAATGRPYSFQSTATNPSPLQVGVTAGAAQATVLFGSIETPNSTASSYIARVTNASRLVLMGFTGPLTQGAGSNGFLASQASQLVYTSSVAQAITGPATGGRLFDLQNGSTLFLGGGGSFVLSSYATLFSIRDTCTAFVDLGAAGNLFTTAAGTAFDAEDGSTVEISRAGIALVAGNTGLKTRNQSTIFLKQGGTLVNNAATPVDSPDGDPVYTAKVQTLSNKDLTATTNSFFGPLATVTQLVALNNPVVLNSVLGEITMFSAVGLFGADVFMVSNSHWGAGSTLMLSSNYDSMINVDNNLATSYWNGGAGTFFIRFRNTGTSATEAPTKISFLVINPV